MTTLVALDQVSKILIRYFLGYGRPGNVHSIAVIGKSLVRFTYVENPGIAFGVDIFGVRSLLVFGWLASVLLAFYLYRLARRQDHLRWPIMLFLTGAIGNSIDRSLFGQVTDFIDVDMPDFIMERFAVFNVADSCVSIGIVILALIVIFGQKKQEEREVLTQAQSVPPPSRPGSPDEGEIPVKPQPNVQLSNQPDSLPSDHRAGPTTGTD